MMKKENSGKRVATKPSPQKIFIQDDASGLVGGIVEKGFSEEPQNRPLRPSSAPRSTVLPFPVARHRSHGPHWAPKSSNFVGAGDDDENYGGEETFTEFGPIAAFANPVQRKQKKGLDFSRWREVTSIDNSHVPQKNEGNRLLVEFLRQNKVSQVNEIPEKINKHTGPENCTQLQRRSPDDDANLEVMDTAMLEGVKLQKQDILDMDADDLLSTLHNYNHLNQDAKCTPLPENCTKFEETSQKGISEAREEIMEETEPELLVLSGKKNQVDMKKYNLSESHMTSSSDSSNLGNEQGAMSLETQIDTENRAQLERMSADEIAEAQSELMKKMSPALIKVLKKRGQDKLKKQKCSSLDMAPSGQVGNLQDEKISINASTLVESDMGHKVITAESKDAQRGLDDNVGQKSSPSSGSPWDAWSKRVEAVRGLRFSLDGSVLKSDFSHIPKTGNISSHSGYSADNVSERDFLRTEGNPAAVGYTIKEALALTRSVVPGQRALALHLLASVLDKASHNICQNKVGCTLKYANTERIIDWEAVWAFALGPEPELALSLRMSLDDNHNSVVLACAKVTQCVLSCEINESFFDISEKVATYQEDVCTAPIFRSRPKIDVGFLHGGYWKYNSKPSNILRFGEDAMDDRPEGEHTIQDDIVVAGQDFAAGLVRMGILARILYLLETDPSVALEECIISILIAIARHSPTCADAIIKCERLVQTIANRFTTKDQMEINHAKIKSVTLMKVLARSEKKNCIEFTRSGIFRKLTWHLYRYAFSLDHWVKLGKENCRLSSALLVEQFRFWKVCIQYGFCVSDFADLFPALCIWLSVPTFEELITNNILCEFAAITTEAYLILEALARRLPKFYSHVDLSNQTAKDTEGMETWCWSHVGPMVDLALKWIALKTDPYLSKFFDWQKGCKSNSVDSTVSSLLWVISAVTHMLSSVLGSVILKDTFSLHGRHVPWLPAFVPKIGLEIMKNGFLSFTQVNGTDYGKDPARVGSFLEYLCYLRNQSEQERSIASVCCLHGIVPVVVSVNKLIQLANAEIPTPPSPCILADGILESSLVEMGTMMTTFMKLIAFEGHCVQSIEMFGRGGPAPGVGVGWGASGGGFWSTTLLLAQMDAGLLIQLLEIFHIVPAKDPPLYEDSSFVMQRINCALNICLIVGPRDRLIMEKALDLLCQVPVLKYLDLCIRHFLRLNKEVKLFGWQYSEEDYQLFSNILASHFKKRWLCVKKLKAEAENKCVGQKTFKDNTSLDTIHEDLDTSNMTNQEHQLTSLVVEWAHQRLPLPMHWFLSPFSTINYSKPADLPGASNMLNFMQDTTDFLEVAKGGLFFLLGIEAVSSFLPSEFCSSVRSVSVIWKLHSLSVVLFVGMGVLEEVKSRDVYEILQEVYGQLLDKSRLPDTEENCSVELLKFQSDIHESYCTFIETLVDQFAAVSYGDLIYGRQVAIYLHRCVEAPVRLAAWNALSNVRSLELLPPLEKCVAKVDGYLEPVEDDEKILEAYVKSWVSGALDRAASRGSVAFTLALHHLSSFIFGNSTGESISLRNKLAKAILRDYSRKRQHEGMMMDFIRYNKLVTCQMPGQEKVPSQMCEMEKRFRLLREACEGNKLLLIEVEKLEKSFRKEQYVAT